MRNSKSKRRLSIAWRQLLPDCTSLSSLGWRVFCGAYVILSALIIELQLDGSTTNFIDRSIADFAYRIPQLRGGRIEEAFNRDGDELIRASLWMSPAALFLLKRWGYIPLFWVVAQGERIGCAWLQGLVARPRPWYPGIAIIPTGSFPSGHTGVVTAIGTFWVVMIVIEYRSRGLKWTAAALFAVIVLITALERVFCLAHWFSDTVGAIAFALCLSLFCFWMHGWINKLLLNGMANAFPIRRIEN